MISLFLSPPCSVNSFDPVEHFKTPSKFVTQSYNRPTAASLSTDVGASETSVKDCQVGNKSLECAVCIAVLCMCVYIHRSLQPRGIKNTRNWNHESGERESYARSYRGCK